MRFLRGGCSKQPRRGIAATEFAAVAPFLALIALGTIDFGRFAKWVISVNNAARNGAYYGAVVVNDPTLIRKAAVDDLVNNLEGIKDTDVTVTINSSTLDAEGYKLMIVKVDVPFSPITSFLGITTLTLSHTAQMRVLPP